MPAFPVAQLIPVLQTAIGPVILISGVGMLLLVMTNRLGRAIDRSRVLSTRLESAAGAARERLLAQLAILYRRAELIRISITLASISALCAALLIIVLFLTALLNLEDALLISALFILCMGCLIGSLIYFIRDINEALAALKLELQSNQALPPKQIRK
jgi:Na+/melibiose symporter-like transporter